MGFEFKYAKIIVFTNKNDVAIIAYKADTL